MLTESRASAPTETQEPAADSIRILIVDDHPTFSEGLKVILSRDPRLVVCGLTENASSALAAFRSLKPDLIVADISMSGVNGIELAKMIIAEDPSTAILVLSMHDEGLYAMRALRAGARGYLMKSESPDTILRAIQRVVDGKTYVSTALGEQLIFKAVQSLKDGLGSPVDALSDRELEVLECFGRGLTTKAVADRLNLSPKTVETHRGHIKEKLKFTDSTALVRFAVEWVANSGKTPASCDLPSGASES